MATLTVHIQQASISVTDLKDCIKNMVLGTDGIQHSARDIATGMQGYHGVPHSYFSTCRFRSDLCHFIRFRQASTYILQQT